MAIKHFYQDYWVSAKFCGSTKTPHLRIAFSASLARTLNGNRANVAISAGSIRITPSLDGAWTLSRKNEIIIPATPTRPIDGSQFVKIVRSVYTNPAAEYIVGLNETTPQWVELYKHHTRVKRDQQKPPALFLRYNKPHGVAALSASLYTALGKPTRVNIYPDVGGIRIVTSDDGYKLSTTTYATRLPAVLSNHPMLVGARGKLCGHLSENGALLTTAVRHTRRDTRPLTPQRAVDRIRIAIRGDSVLIVPSTSLYRKYAGTYFKLEYEPTTGAWRLTPTDDPQLGYKFTTVMRVSRSVLQHGTELVDHVVQLAADPTLPIVVGNVPDMPNWVVIPRQRNGSKA